MHNKETAKFKGGVFWKFILLEMILKCCCLKRYRALGVFSKVETRHIVKWKCSGGALNTRVTK